MYMYAINFYNILGISSWISVRQERAIHAFAVFLLVNESSKDPIALEDVVQNLPIANDMSHKLYIVNGLASHVHE